ncbi:MAG TPA: glycosyltransferase [Thermoguttaceae bacterium]
MTGSQRQKETMPFAAPSGIQELDIAVLIPCYNEELTIASVIADFRVELPLATIYVFDNNSTDRTAEIASQAGAVVLRERRQGKGFVVQSMFRMIEADIYVMIDGDGTYPACEAKRLIAPIKRGEADMVVGSRLHAESNSKFRQLNMLGNRIFLSMLNVVFHVRLTDILSGYRAFSREFVKTVALVGGGFEVETELTIKALEAGFHVAEVPVDLTVRPDGSFSKIRPMHDGLRILGTIFALLRDYKPLTFFGVLAIALVLGGCVAGIAPIFDYLDTGNVIHVPRAILATGMVLLGMLQLTAGMILHCMTRRIREVEYQLRRNIASMRVTSPVVTALKVG